MKRRFFKLPAAACILLLTTFAGYAAGRQGRDDSADVERIVAELKRDLVQAYLRADTAELARIYSDDFTVTDAAGNTRTKAEEIANLQATGSTLTAGTYEPISIRVFDDVAVMSGHGDLRGKGASGEYHHSYYSFNVFVRRGGRWQYAAAFTP
jgi:ketosteroid isomerase-like protein